MKKKRLTGHDKKYLYAEEYCLKSIQLVNRKKIITRSGRFYSVSHKLRYPLYFSLSFCRWYFPGILPPYESWGRAVLQFLYSRIAGRSAVWSESPAEKTALISPGFFSFYPWFLNNEKTMPEILCSSFFPQSSFYSPCFFVTGIGKLKFFRNFAGISSIEASGNFFRVSNALPGQLRTLLCDVSALLKGKKQY